MGLVVGFVIGFFHLIPFMARLVGLPIVLLLSWVDDAEQRRLVAVVAVFAFSNWSSATSSRRGWSATASASIRSWSSWPCSSAAPLFGFFGMLAGRARHRRPVRVLERPARRLPRERVLRGTRPPADHAHRASRP